MRLAIIDDDSVVYTVLHGIEKYNLDKAVERSIVIEYIMATIVNIEGDLPFGAEILFGATEPVIDENGYHPERDDN